MPELATAVREITFGDAIKEAIAEEMRRDPKVVLMGEDVAEAGTTFKVLTGLVDEFGKDRIIDTPISEAGFTGIEMTTWYFRISVSTIALTMISVTSVVRKARSRR